MYMRYKILQLLIFLGFSSSARSQESVDGLERDDWRSRCREMVAGAYINDYDRSRQNEVRLPEIKSQLVKLKKLEKDLDLKITKKKREFDRQEFSKKLTFELQRLKSKKANVSIQAENLRGVISRTQSEYDATSLHLKTLKTLIKPVFKKVDDINARKGSYGFTLEYISPCPKYRSVCPLPKKQAKALEKISEFLKSSTACKRYAKIV